MEAPEKGSETNRCPKRKGDAPQRKGLQGGLGGAAQDQERRQGFCQQPQSWERRERGKSSQGMGVGTAAGGPHNAHRTHPVPHSPPCLGPSLPLTHTCFSPLPCRLQGCLLLQNFLSLYDTHTHTHTSFLYGLAPGTPHHIHSSTLSLGPEQQSWAALS